MTARARHHFVPRFYLSAFESAPRRVNLYNVRNNLAIRDASLKDQCYRRRFYGPDESVEQALGTLEDHAARVLRDIRSRRTLPAQGTEGHLVVCAFVASQLLRTTIAARRVNAQVDKVWKQAYADDPRLSEVDIDTLQVGYGDPVLASLVNLGPYLEAILDLKAHLIAARRGAFLTSDNPAFKYNQYCEGIDYAGTTGALCLGFQIFMPLEPTLALVLFDSTTYTTSIWDRWGRRSAATPSDVQALNAMQFISADEHVYFSDWASLERVRGLATDTAQHRLADPTVVVEYGQDYDPSRSLLHTFERTPCVGLRLSFLSLKRSARAVPLDDRIRRHRREFALPATPPPAHLRGRTVTFSRFIGRR